MSCPFLVRLFLSPLLVFAPFVFANLLGVRGSPLLSVFARVIATMPQITRINNQRWFSRFHLERFKAVAGRVESGNCTADARPADRADGCATQL